MTGIDALRRRLDRIVTAQSPEAVNSVVIYQYGETDEEIRARRPPE